MDICGEHGEEIAYVGRDCPACEQVESLKDEYETTISGLEQDLADADDRIDELTDELKEKQ